MSDLATTAYAWLTEEMGFRPLPDRGPSNEWLTCPDGWALVVDPVQYDGWESIFRDLEDFQKTVRGLLALKPDTWGKPLDATEYPWALLTGGGR